MRQTLTCGLQSSRWLAAAKEWRTKRHVLKQLFIRLRSNTTRHNIMIDQFEPFPSPSAPDSDSDTIIADDPKTPSPSPKPEPSPSPDP